MTLCSKLMWETALHLWINLRLVLVHASLYSANKAGASTNTAYSLQHYYYGSNRNQGYNLKELKEALGGCKTLTLREKD